MSDRRRFTVEEANSLIPTLEVMFTQVMQLRAQLRSAYHELEDLGEPPTVETLKLAVGTSQLQRARSRFRALMEALTEELQQIETMGISVKDLDLGLCDFLGLRDGREVWLCWQFGEKKVGFWHDLHHGFAHRRPLESSGSASRMLH